MSLLNVSYEEVQDKALQARIEKRFGTMMDRVEHLGFEFETYYREIVWTHTALLMLPFVLLMRLSGTVMRLEFPFRVSIYNPLLIHRDLNTYAELSPPGDLMFITLFSKQKMLVTSTMETSDSKPALNYYRQNFPGMNVEPLWQKHQEQLQFRQRSGWNIETVANFKTFAQLMHRNNHTISRGIAI